ncbi:MAG: glycosyltransferase [Candidatus Krumholzibacteriia bacterium]
MKVSVEISTFNRRDVLARVLEALANQTYSRDEFEVVLSDDGSAEDIAGLVESLEGSLPYSIRFLANEHRGCGYAHNRGIRQAKGDLVVMLAADLIPEPRLLEEHVRSHTAEPDPTVVVAGKMKQSDELPQTAFQRGWNAIVEEMFVEKDGEPDYRDFWVSNLSFKRDFMIRHGMFREWPAAAHEDLELGYRLEQNGMKLIYNPMALGHHHHAETLTTVAKRSYAHGYNWHHLEEEVPDVRIRMKSGRLEPADGWMLYLNCRIKAALRKVLLNRYSITHIAIPLINRAETAAALAALVPFLTRKVASYNFHRGVVDYKKQQSQR